MAEKGLDYKSLAEAGTENYRTGKRPVIEYPGTEVVDFYGFKSHSGGANILFADGHVSGHDSNSKVKFDTVL